MGTGVEDMPVRFEEPRRAVLLGLRAPESGFW